MRPTLELRAAQRLTMTPQLQYSLRLLQLSALEFEQEIEQALSNNPFLERTEEESETASGSGPETEVPAEPIAQTDSSSSSSDPQFSDDDGYGDRDSYRARQTDSDDEDSEPGTYTAAHQTLRDMLLGELRGTALRDGTRSLVLMLIEALDEDGYLRQPLEDLHALYSKRHEIDRQDLEVALKFLQSIAPTGVAARSLRECLQLQLNALPSGTPGLACALAIVDRHLELLATHDTSSLLRALGCDVAALREANCLIKSLDPRPGARFSNDHAQYVVADVIVKKVKNRWTAAINPAVVPPLHINRLYADALRRNRAAGSAQLGQQLQEARWLIRNVQQRFTTIQRVAQAIIDRQKRSFEHGDVAMRPLVLREIASELDLHPSTVSRVTSNKYMATPRGLIEFKHFFGSHVLAEDGVACSAIAIRALIKQIIAAEDSRNPLSDIKLTKLLGERGIRVARRTVSKYRDSMHIPPVEARRMASVDRGDSIQPRASSARIKQDAKDTGRPIVPPNQRAVLQA